MHHVELYLLGSAFLVGACVALTRFFNTLGIPFLLLFIGVGMLAGAEGAGLVEPTAPWLAQTVGIVCLALILFAGGLDTHWERAKTALKPALLLATVGTLVTALVLGWAASRLLGLPLLHGLLVGAILSSTDASAVFSVLRTRDIRLKGNLRELLELESGINDPMAVFLTLACIRLAVHPGTSPLQLLGMFGSQMVVGTLVGAAAGLLFVELVNRLRTPQDGMYPVFTLAMAFVSFGAAGVLGGSGFLAVFLTGAIAAWRGFVQRRSTERFIDGLAWLAQIILFLVLGLVVLPTRLWDVAGEGVLLTLVMILVARPVAALVSLLPLGYSWRESLFVGWVGLRGAVPVVLATFPLLAGVPGAASIMDIVFFAVLGSSLLQGTTIAVVARWLGVSERVEPTVVEEHSVLVAPDAEEIEVLVPFGSRAVGRPLLELRLPSDSQVILLGRGDEIIVPEDNTVLQGGDILKVLASPGGLERLRMALDGSGEE